MTQIGIHVSPGSFSDRWIEYCNEKRLPYRRINCLASNVISQCEEVDVILWHWSHDDPTALLVAPQIIAALEHGAIDVFPSIATCAHYDDKVAQKYLLEAIGAPLIPSWVFLDESEAREWIRGATFPKVFKLRRGAGSTNVRLVRSVSEAKALCGQAFGDGFRASAGYFSDIRTKVRGTGSFHDYWMKIRRAPHSLATSIAKRRQMQRQRGYFYVQEYLPGNTFDTRITIIGNRAFGFRRMNRPNDFRASGSGMLKYEPTQIDMRAVEIAFDVSRKLDAQSLAFDFLFDAQHELLIGEISYCYKSIAIYNCPGWWDTRLEWHEGHVWPQDLILENLLAAREKRGQG